MTPDNTTVGADHLGLTGQTAPTGRPRLDVVDALRGFALLGVVVSNVAVFAGAGAVPAAPSAVDQQIGLLVSYLVTGKFLAIFALTFGLSYGLSIRRYGEDPSHAASRHWARLISLLIIGAAHRVLFGADILMTYAVLGLILLVLRTASTRVLVMVALVSLAIPDLWMMVADRLQYRPAPLITRAERTRLAVDGRYFELVQFRAVMLLHWWRELVGQGMRYLPLLLAGFWMARARVIERTSVEPRALVIVVWGSAALMLCGYWIQSVLRPGLGPGAAAWTSVAFGLAWTLTTYFQAIVYAGGLLWLWSTRQTGRHLLRHLVPAGRMALTNYLAVSVMVTAFVFSTRSYGRLGSSEAYGLGVVLWLLELVVSAWWLAHYRLGPAEWAWRSMTGPGRAETA